MLRTNSVYIYVKYLMVQKRPKKDIVHSNVIPYLAISTLVGHMSTNK